MEVTRRRVLVLSVPPHARRETPGPRSLWPRLLVIDVAEEMLRDNTNVGAVVVSEPDDELRRGLVERLVAADPLVAVFVLVEAGELEACQARFRQWLPGARVTCHVQQVLSQFTDALIEAACETMRLRARVVA